MPLFKEIYMAETSPLPRTSPEAQGVSSAALLDFVNALDQSITEMHGLVLLRHGQVIAEGWWQPCGPQIPHMLFSLTKSFTSTAVGLAVAEGLLSVDDFVISFFPDKNPKRISKNLAAMRVRHLLSMVTGHKKEPNLGRAMEDKQADWVKAFLAASVGHKPGAPFVYNSAASHVLSAIVQKVTGQPLLDYLTPRLFEPLGIQPAHWDQDPSGIYTGGWGLMIRTEEIARFGQMYLQKGVWNGKRILPEAWVAAATSRQVENGTDPKNDWNQGYGYQFWRCQHNVYRGDGAFGQFCFVMPDQDAVLAINSGVPDMQAVMNVVWDKLLPAIQPAALPAAPQAEKALRGRLAELSLPVPADAPVSPLAAQFGGKTYLLEGNTFKIESIRFAFTPDGCELSLRERGEENHASFGYHGWKFGESTLFANGKGPVAAHAAWVKPETLQLVLRQYSAPFVFTVDFSFAGDSVTMEGKVNVGFGPNQFPVIKGQAGA
jgi:CubicO group peptidase (beta-lactamase class C family)